MKYMKKIIGLKLIIIISYLTIVVPASASGFIFDWQLFVADPDLALGHSSRKISIKDSSAADIGIPASVDSKDIFSLSSDQNNDSTPKSETKSLPGKVKIIFFGENTFMPTRDEAYANSDDKQVSKFINAMSSFIYDDSKIKSAETMGKIIEPQINFYFSF
ncbi:MAG: hypothetical protein ABSC11_11470 [Smithella sp.]|jgi:hypothetical protein